VGGGARGSRGRAGARTASSDRNLVATAQAHTPYTPTPTPHGHRTHGHQPEEPQHGILVAERLQVQLQRSVQPSPHDGRQHALSAGRQQFQQLALLQAVPTGLNQCEGLAHDLLAQLVAVGDGVIKDALPAAATAADGALIIIVALVPAAARPTGSRPLLLDSRDTAPSSQRCVASSRSAISIRQRLSPQRSGARRASPGGQIALHAVQHDVQQGGYLTGKVPDLIVYAAAPRAVLCLQAQLLQVRWGKEGGGGGL